MSDKTLEEKVMEAIGAASMCWDETPTGVFDEKRAREIGIELFHEMWDALAEAWDEGHRHCFHVEDPNNPVKGNHYREESK